MRIKKNEADLVLIATKNEITKLNVMKTDTEQRKAQSEAKISELDNKLQDKNLTDSERNVIQQEREKWEKNWKL